MKNKLLIHACCGPCLVGVYDDISENLEIFSLENMEDVDILWYNINIQPKHEYLKRKETLIEYLHTVKKVPIIQDEYDLAGFACIASNPKAYEYESRCEYCYKKRLDFLFSYASDNGYTMVTTTLLTSPYQKHDQIIRICESLEKKYNIKFMYKDFREDFRAGQTKAKDLGLYKQKYCGCIFSIDEGSVK